MKFSRLGGAVGAALLVVGLSAVDAGAQDYPTRAVTVLVPFAPGGANDIAGRAIADHLSKTLGQSFVVENRPGAGGALGVQGAASAEPDGYTLVVAPSGPISILPTLDATLGYDTEKDLAAVATIATADILAVAKADSRFSSMKEVIDEARANPGALNFATSGVATTAHLDMENLLLMADVKMTHVPFNGDTPAITAVLGGTVDFAFVGSASSSALITGGELKPLAAGGPERAKALPDVATIEEQASLPGYSAKTWYVLFTRAGTPDAVIQKLNSAVNEALADPAIIESFESRGLNVVSGSVEDAEKFVADDLAVRRRVIAATGIRRE